MLRLSLNLGTAMKPILGLLLGLMITGVSATEIRDITQFDLKQYHGKVVYLDFWASWCKPCQKSFPWMNSLMDKYPADQFAVVTINLDQNSEDMTRFLDHVPARFIVFHDPNGTVAEQFRLPGMPTSFILDKTGKAISKHVGFFRNKAPAIEAQIEALL